MKFKFSNLFKLNTKQRKNIIPTVFGLLVPVFMVILFVGSPQFFTSGKELLFDAYQKQAPRDYKPEIPVRVVDIDEDSIKLYGQWPWPRTVLAEFNQNLTDNGALVIAYDLIFSEIDRTSPENLIDIFAANPNAANLNATEDFENIRALKSHDAVFADAIARSNVVTGFFLINEKNDARPKRKAGFSYGGTDPRDALPSYLGAIPALEILETNANGTGFVSFHAKGDGIIRTAPLMSRLDGKVYPALSIEALRVVQGAGSFKIRGNDASGETKSIDKQIVALQVGEFELPTTADGSMRMYYTNEQPGRTISAWQVLANDPADTAWKQKVYNNIVFVGTSAEGLKDLIATPVNGRLPGVEAHAQIVEQILGQQFLRRPDWMVGFEIMLFIGLGVLLALVVPYLGATKGAVFSFAIAAAVFYGSWYAFKQHQMLFDPVFILTGILLSYLVITLSSFYLTESERSQIRSAFSMYLSPTMVKKISEDPSLLTLGGEERSITILFLDIRGFSKISHELAPNEITAFLNIFLTPMTNILQDSQATIDKYIGDAIVAFWNAPLDDAQHEQNAARAVMSMMRSLDVLNAKYEDDEKINWPKNVRMGIGLNTGVCCVGNLGSEQRFSYSMIGDAANLASRIEGLTKQYRVHVLVGNSTAEKLDGFALVEADLIQVVGRSTPERVFILAGEEEQAATEAYKALIPLHKKFLKAYRSQNWKAAEALIPELKTLARSLDFHGYYDVMSERIAGYKSVPPNKNWGGVYVATSK